MSSKDKTSRAEKNFFNAFRCKFFTLKNPIFTPKTRFLLLILPAWNVFYLNNQELMMKTVVAL
jgi:hypothetical protein